MPLSIFFPARTTRTIGVLELDATTEEVHERTGQVTENPIEGGTTVSDHIVRDAVALTMSGVVTDTPLVQLFGLTQQGRAQNAYDLLDELWQTGAMIEVQTGYQLYTNMVIETLRMPKTREAACRFTATLKRLNISTSETTRIPGDNTLDPDTAASELNAGRQQTTEAATTEATQGRSFLSRILGGG